MITHTPRTIENAAKIQQGIDRQQQQNFDLERPKNEKYCFDLGELKLILALMHALEVTYEFHMGKCMLICSHFFWYISNGLRTMRQAI